MVEMNDARSLTPTCPVQSPHPHQRPEHQAHESGERDQQRFRDFEAPQDPEARKPDERRGPVDDRPRAEQHDGARDGAGGGRRGPVHEGLQLRIVAVAFEPGGGEQR